MIFFFFKQMPKHKFCGATLRWASLNIPSICLLQFSENVSARSAKKIKQKGKFQAGGKSVYLRTVNFCFRSSLLRLTTKGKQDVAPSNAASPSF